MKDDFFFDSNRESTVEDTVVAWAENHGWIARPMAYRGRRDCPDYFFFGYGTIKPMEFKKEIGGELSAGQNKEHKRLAAVGVRIPVIDNAEDGIEVLRKAMC